MLRNVYTLLVSWYLVFEDSNLHLHRRRSDALSMFRTEASRKEDDCHAERTLQCLQMYTLTKSLKAEK